MARRNSPLEELFLLLYELSGSIWQVGAVLAALFGFGAFMAFAWAEKQNSDAAGSAYAHAITDAIGWLYYSVPAVFAVLCLIFGARACASALRSRCL